MRTPTDVIIVGGGAAGLLCAGVAARRGRRVLVLEKKERCARKLMITGKGRCNVTNNCGLEELIGHTVTNGRFLYSAFSAFMPQDLMTLLRGLGVPLKTERGGRVFPESDKSADIVDALVKYARSADVKILTGESASELIIKDKKIKGLKTAAGSEYYAESVVISTGGMSYPLTGSTGDGYLLAKQAGHEIIPTRPSLIPVVARESFCGDLMGLTLKNCKLKLMKKGNKKPVYEELGELLFTHFGVSGPLVLSASAYMSGNVGDYVFLIDLKPGLTFEQLDERLRRDFQENINRDYFNSLSALLPRKLIPVTVKLSGIDGRTKVHQITKAQRQGIAALLKGFRVTPVEFRPIEEAVITCGGVKTGEINPKTMESKLVSRLYFAGEVIDVDAYTGGFNLQIAFSTGFLAGENA